MLFAVRATAQMDAENEKAVFEDKESETSIHWPGGRTFRANVADASLKLSYSHTSDTDAVVAIRNRPLTWGVELSGKTNDGVLPILSSGTFTPGFKIGGVLGYYTHYSLTSTNAWLTLKVGYEGAKLKLINTDTSYNEQITSQTFEGLSVALGYNIIPGDLNNLIIGLGVSFKKANNYSTLDDLELTETHVYLDTITGATRTSQTTIAGKTGTYRAYNRFDIQEDIYWIPVPRLGIYQYARCKVPEGSDAVFSLGAGAYLLTENALSSRAGIVFEYSDLTNGDTPTAEHISVNLVVGFNFGK